MADIQKCPGCANGAGMMCKKRDDCYRYTAKASERQAWGEPGTDYDYRYGCSLFWSNLMDKVVRK